MKISIGFRRNLLAMLVALGASACSSTAPVVNAPPTAGELMAQAAAAAAANQKEAAVALWKQAAASYPAEKEPWARIAQARYDAGLYGEAVVNAQQVLLRDPADKFANGIVASSGMRLSSRSLAELYRQNSLPASLRSESLELAKYLRDSLGESVPLPAREKAPGRTPVRKPAAKSPTAVSDRNDPFGGLK
jgi:tetratricopeptide (TPR) repeat protein